MTTQVEAAVAVGPGAPFEFKRLTLDAPRPDEVLVRIVAVGLCHTDLVFRDAQLLPPPAVLGHEGAGIVEQVGAEVTKVAPGDRVALTFRSCGACQRCAASHPAYCASMPALNVTGARPDGSGTLSSDDGPVAGSFFGQSSFATHALAYERNVVKVPDDLPLEIMGPLGCGIQTGAGGVMRSLACERGSSLLVTGGGPVGLSAVMGGRIQGCSRIILVEPHASRRQLALELGATDVIDPAAEPDLIAAVRALLPEGVDYAFDTTGVPGVLNASVAALATMGTLGFVGFSPPGTPLPCDANTAMGRGLTIKGIIEGDSDPDLFIPELMEHYRRGELPFDRMITMFPFHQINEAIAAQHRGECTKIVLTMDDTSGGQRP